IQSRIIYPDDAKRAGIEGTVRVKVLVDTTGTTIKFEVAESLTESCDQVAIEALKATKFTPAKSRGRKVPFWIAIPIKFKLRNRY
ncbi:energy transducer TonB, partial [candidate division KSB1 bacterium]